VVAAIIALAFCFLSVNALDTPEKQLTVAAYTGCDRRGQECKDMSAENMEARQEAIDFKAF